MAVKYQGGQAVPLLGGAAVKARREAAMGREAWPPGAQEQMSRLSGLFTSLIRMTWVYPGDPNRAKQDAAYQELLRAQKAWELAASKLIAAHK